MGRRERFHLRDNDVLRSIATIGRSEIPPSPDPDRSPTAPAGLGAFAVGTDLVQLAWRRLGPGAMTIGAGEVVALVDADGGPGAVTLTGLAPGTSHTATVEGPGIDGRVEVPFRTLTPPPGEELFRIGTLNDVHIGQRATGFLHTITEKPTPAVPHADRCLTAALDEAVAWGAQQLLVKGDLTHVSTKANWERIGALLEPSPVPVEIVPGNHETSKWGTVEPQGGLGAHGFRMVRGVQVVDRPGIRIVLADSTVPDSDWGQVDSIREQVLDLAARAPGGVLLGIHHQPMDHAVPTYIPPGIPAAQWKPFVRELARANPDVLVSTGHTHRHRAKRYGPIVVTEVGSTKDYPGTWAGYQVFEGGIVQVVRRIEEPSCIRWTEWTGRAALGVWRWWSPGSLDDRCLTVRWRR